MVYFPVRKCYFIAKVSLLIFLVVSILGLFEKWRGGKRSASALSEQEEEYEREILEDEAKIIPGLGEGGVAAYLTGADKAKGEESQKKLAMNVYLSDRIAYNRTLEDHRHPACTRLIYDAELPSASVILIFHNEPYSVVLRTIWSVINSCKRDLPWFKQAKFIDKEGRRMNLGYPGQDPSSPLVYLKEIILVDDNSTLPELKGKLSHYVRTRLPPDLIRILRLPDRIGLTQARMAGSRVARSTVLIFLDSHCEAVRDWMRPLLHHIKHKRNVVVTPLIDTIEKDTFMYEWGGTDVQGLMKARIRGARAARGDVLIFLDAHCEGESDWMRPLLQRVRDKRDAVVTPIIDVLEQETFQLESAEVFQVGGFTFMGHFTWIDVPEKEKKRRGSDISPTWSPTMAGGLFAINRAYYWELGAYDEQMAGWGGENLEMSFRIWQCGGTLETVPCSRVGHVFRSFHPYGMPAESDTHGINTARMAEVWMDEYAEIFYLYRPDLRGNPKIGDVTHRKILREKLKCKNFQWFLDNIYKEKFVPVRDAYGYGRFQNPASGLCIDSLQRDGNNEALGVYPCHPGLQATQYYSLSLANELRNEESCAQIEYKRRTSEEDGKAGRKVTMATCQNKIREQKWKYKPLTKQIMHVESQLCLDAGTVTGADLLAKTCTDSNTQQWVIDYSEENDFKMSNEIEPSEQETRLNRLRGQRRKSRSLLSYDDTLRRRHHKKHRKRSKKNKTKNKFILKLVRTLMNNTEEHLEVDIHCKHKQLYPNNTFVRDLVTILNERNIKVINNGRVFERNKVTQLNPKANKEEKVLNKMDITTKEEETEEILKKPRARKRKPTAPGHLLPKMPVNEPIPREQTANVYKNNEHEAMKLAQTMRLTERINEKILAQSEPLNEQTNGNVSDFTSPRSHRIIIEDFIEMTPSVPVHSKRMKKRKRKRVTTPTPIDEDSILSVLAQNAANNVEEQINIPPHSEEKESMEDSPMLSEGEAINVRSYTNVRDKGTRSNLTRQHTQKESKTRQRIQEESKTRQRIQEESKDKQRIQEESQNRQRIQKESKRQRKQERKTDKEIAKEINDARERDRSIAWEKERISESDIDEIWPIGESRFRVKDSGRRRDPIDSLEQTDMEKQNEENMIEETAAFTKGTPSPVKVVMRSNLTFNLGEEFFKWKARNRDGDSELSIPSARNPLVQAWLRGDDITTTESQPEDDVIATGHINREDKKESDETSSSDSTSSEKE